MNPNKCFVGLFDILGFKALRAERGTAGLYRLYERAIVAGVQHSAAGKGKTEVRGGTSYWVPDFNEQSVGFRIFSDTVLLYTKDDSVASFFAIVNSGSQLLVQGLSGTKAPFRGAIGYGDFIDDGIIIVGSALEDAHAWESRQAWSGAMFTPACLAFISEQDYVNTYRRTFEQALMTEEWKENKNKLRIAMKKLIFYEVPIKSEKTEEPYDKITALVFDWTLSTYEGAAKDAFIASKAPHALVMQNNTISFENWARRAAAGSNQSDGR